MEFRQNLFIELIVLYVRLIQLFFQKLPTQGRVTSGGELPHQQTYGYCYNSRFLLRFLILNEFDILCGEITWTNPRYAPNNGNFLCLQISFVLFTGDRAGVIKWTPLIKLWISFLHVAFERKKERNLPTIKKGPGYITRKRAVHPRMEKSHSGWAPTE